MQSRGDKETGRDRLPVPKRFPPKEEDIHAIGEIAKQIRSQTPSMSISQLRPAATVLLALERLPLASPGLRIPFGFLTPDTDGNHAWADLEIREQEFQLGLCRRLFDAPVGGDTEFSTAFETMAETASRTGDIGDWLISATAIPNAECITVQDESQLHAAGFPA